MLSIFERLFITFSTSITKGALVSVDSILQLLVVFIRQYSRQIYQKKSINNKNKNLFNLLVYRAITGHTGVDSSTNKKKIHKSGKKCQKVVESGKIIAIFTGLK